MPGLYGIATEAFFANDGAVSHLDAAPRWPKNPAMPFEMAAAT